MPLMPSSERRDWVIEMGSSRYKDCAFAFTEGGRPHRNKEKERKKIQDTLHD